MAEQKMSNNQQKPTTEQLNNTFRSDKNKQKTAEKPVDTTPQNTQSVTPEPTSTAMPQEQTTKPEITPNATPVRPTEQKVPESVSGQPIFVERQLQKDLDKYMTDQELLQGVVSKDITKKHLQYMKAVDPERYNKAINYLSGQDAKQRASRIRETITINQEEAEVVEEAPTFVSELEKAQQQAQEFYTGLIEQTQKTATTFSAQDLYNKTVNTEELSAKREEANKLAQELEELQIKRARIRAEVEDQYGDGVPKAAIEAEIAKRARSFTDEELVLQSRYRSALAEYEGAEQDAQTQFDLALNDAQRQEEMQFNSLQQTIGLSKEAFNSWQNSQLAILDFKQQEYLKKMDFEQQISMYQVTSALDTQRQKELYKFQQDYAEQNETNVQALTLEDGSIAIYDVKNQQMLDTIPSRSAQDYQPTEDDLKTINLSYNDQYYKDRSVTLAGPAATAFEQANKEFREQYGRDIKIGAEATSSFRSQEQQIELFGRGRTEEQLVRAGINKTMAKKYANANAKVVTYTRNQSRHMKGLAVDLLDIDEVNKAKPFLEKYGLVQQSHGFGDYVNFEYQGPITEEEQQDLSPRAWGVINGVNKISNIPEEAERTSVIVELQNYVEQTIQQTNDPIERKIIESMIYQDDMTSQGFQKINSIFTVRNMMGKLEELLQEEENLDPIVGALRSRNPYDVKAEQIKSTIIAAVPGLARGIFDEVGVLTDADIERYSKTLPNLSNKKEVNDFVINMLNDLLLEQFEFTIKGEAMNRNNVYGRLDEYKNFNNPVSIKVENSAIRDEDDYYANQFLNTGGLNTQEGFTTKYDNVQ